MHIKYLHLRLTLKWSSNWIMMESLPGGFNNGPAKRNILRMSQKNRFPYINNLRQILRWVVCAAEIELKNLASSSPLYLEHPASTNYLKNGKRITLWFFPFRRPLRNIRFFLWQLPWKAICSSRATRFPVQGSVQTCSNYNYQTITNEMFKRDSRHRKRQQTNPRCPSAFFSFPRVAPKI